VRSDVAVHVYGDDLDLLKRKADEIVRVVSRVRGAADVKAEQTTACRCCGYASDRQGRSPATG